MTNVYRFEETDTFHNQYKIYKKILNIHSLSKLHFNSIGKVGICGFCESFFRGCPIYRSRTHQEQSDFAEFTVKIKRINILNYSRIKVNIVYIRYD